MPALSTVSDEFVENTLDKSLTIEKKSYTPIKDENIMVSDKKIEVKKRPVEYDEIIPAVKINSVKKKIVLYEEDEAKKVNVKIKTPISTKTKIDEGDYIDFETTEDVTINNKFYPKGTPVKARIETISLNQSWGVPADLILENLTVDDIPLSGEIKEIGANRSLWVYPLVYGTSWFFGVGVIFIPIRGGHAKIKPSKIYTLYLQ